MANAMYYKEESKKNWYTTEDITPEHLQLGGILRIADAVEIIANSYSKIIEERDMYKRRYNEESNKRKRLEKRIAGLKGAITKMKKKK